MTSGLSRVTWTDRPTGTAMPPAPVSALYTGASCVATFVPLASRYSNCHANWPAIEWLPRDHEQEQHDGRRDERPDDLDDVVPVGLRRQLGVRGPTPVADDAPHDQRLDDDEDPDRKGEHDVVQPADLMRLGRDGTWRVERIAPTGQEHGCDERGQDHHDGARHERVGRGPLPGATRHRQSSTG